MFHTSLTLYGQKRATMDMTQPGLGNSGKNVTVGQGHQNVIPLNNVLYCTLDVTQGQIVR